MSDATSSSSRPVIGLCTCLEPAAWGVWHRDACLLDAGYVQAVQRAAGNAILLPPDPAAIGDPAQVLDMVDGLLLAGSRHVQRPMTGRLTSLLQSDRIVAVAHEGLHDNDVFVR